ncbi:CocE/NonD family hydrolase [Chloroflexota bacterium]
MFSKTWKTSERKYNVVVERDLRIIMSDGTEISADVFRPESDEKFPALLGIHPYPQQPQTAPIKPSSFSSVTFPHPLEEKGRGWIESGDPNFHVRRGYVQVVANVRGIGKSGGNYDFMGPQEIQDTYEVIEWMAKQPWCDGKVGMFGVSYFAWIQIFVAALNPPSLKCIFAPHGLTDFYRDWIYRGGIFGYNFLRALAKDYSNPRFESITRKMFGDEKLKELIDTALQDEDIMAIPGMAEVLKNPDEGINPILADVMLNPLDGPFWEERKAKYDTTKVPAYFGGCWATYGLHLLGAFRNWENLKVPKKMVIGPPMYLDRPFYQLQYESLRWFDYWLKGIDTGIMDEPPVRLFVMGTNQWKETNDWPLPETKWTPFYLHEDELLSEHEHWPNESHVSYEDSPWHRGYLEYYSPDLVEDTEVIGPIVLNLYASTTDDEVLWLISLREVDQQGNEKILTRGWLRGTHREVDPKRSSPWAPFHPHTKSQPLTPGKIYEFNISVVPTANLFKAGSKIGLKISCTDDAPKHAFEQIAAGNIRRQSSSRITVYQDADHPSHLLLPITKGNILGTFLSGGKPYV